MSAAAMESRARRAARRAGWIARKGRARLDTINDRGGFRLIDPDTNTIVYGERFNLSAEDVLDLVREAQEGTATT